MFPLSSQSRIDVVKSVMRAELNLTYSIWSVGGLGMEVKNSFSIKQESSRLLPYMNKFQNSITFEMSLDQKIYIREVITMLDLLGDLGGLFAAIRPLCFLIVSLF